MKVKRFITGPIFVNTYVVYDEDSADAIIIDAGGSAEEIVEFVKENKLQVKGIYNTHGHFDHVMGAKAIQDNLQVGFYLNKNDSMLVGNLPNQLSLYGIDPVMPPRISGYIDENTDLFIGDKKVKVIETPGHTKGGVCFWVEDLLFSGDTLFLESIGRTDFPGGDYNELRTSVREKLFILPENVKVFPGHDDATSIEHEKKYNMMV